MGREIRASITALDMRSLASPLIVRRCGTLCCPRTGQAHTCSSSGEQPHFMGPLPTPQPKAQMHHTVHTKINDRGDER